MNGIPLTEELKATLTQFYVYAYIRQRNSPIGNAGTPYYIGKGKDDRAWEKHGKTPVPKDISRIIIVDHNLTEEEAFTLEVKMIADYGRVDNNTGILRNRTDGGEGPSGAIRTDATKLKISKSTKGKTFSDATKLLMSKANANKGKPISDATKLKISKAKKGKTFSDATKLLMSKAKKGRIYITDGINNRIIHSADIIPLGWRKGRSHRINTVASGSSIYAFLDGTS
jgi:NUMOD3 motif